MISIGLSPTAPIALVAYSVINTIKKYFFIFDIPFCFLLNKNHQIVGGREVRKIIKWNDPVVFGMPYHHGIPTYWSAQGSIRREPRRRCFVGYRHL